MYIENQEHCGAIVKTNVAMDLLRKDQCLCINCCFSGYGDSSCETAKQFYEICKRDNIAMAITRCPRFEHY
jgi:hypothetical protein